MGEERAKISDPAVMRALAHPARLAILDHLSLNEAGATATECADVVGLSPSATSYHLRALARAGMIEEGASRGDGRERVWQRKYAHYSMTGDPDAGPEDFAAEMALVESFLAHENDKVRRYLVSGKQEGGEWYDVATISERVLALTAKELSQLLGQIEEMIHPYLRAERRDPPASSRRVSFQLRAVPLIIKDVK